MQTAADYDRIRENETNVYLDYQAKREERDVKDLVNAKLETITDEEFHETVTEAEFSFPELYRSLILQVRANDQTAVGHILCLMVKRQLEEQANKALRQGKRFDEVWA